MPRFTKPEASPQKILKVRHFLEIDVEGNWPTLREVRELERIYSIPDTAIFAMEQGKVFFDWTA